MTRARPATALALLLAVGIPCASCATANPERGGGARPGVRTPAERAAGGEVPPAPEFAPATPEPAPEPAPTTPEPDSAPAPEPAETAIIGEVGGKPITREDLLVRAWWRACPQVAGVLDQLVTERLVLLEAARLEIALAPERVEEELARAWSVLEEAERAGGPSPEEQIRQRGFEPDFFRAQLRHDTIVDLLLERTARAWTLESDRRVVQVLEVDGGEALAAVQEGLAAGRPFGELALAHGAGETGKAGGTRMTLVQSEASPLGRVAFHTGIGEVAGPLPFEDRNLFLLVEREEPAIDAERVALRPLLEASLIEREVGEVEFHQWRQAMARRYEIDLEPFFELVR